MRISCQLQVEVPLTLNSCRCSYWSFQFCCPDLVGFCGCSGGFSPAFCFLWHVAENWGRLAGKSGPNNKKKLPLELPGMYIIMTWSPCTNHGLAVLPECYARSLGLVQLGAHAHTLLRQPAALHMTRNITSFAHGRIQHSNPHALLFHLPFPKIRYESQVSTCSCNWYK